MFFRFITQWLKPAFHGTQERFVEQVQKTCSVKWHRTLITCMVFKDPQRKTVLHQKFFIFSGKCWSIPSLHQHKNQLWKWFSLCDQFIQTKLFLENDEHTSKNTWKLQEKQKCCIEMLVILVVFFHCNVILVVVSKYQNCNTCAWQPRKSTYFWSSSETYILQHSPKNPTSGSLPASSLYFNYFFQLLES